MMRYVVTMVNGERFTTDTPPETLLVPTTPWLSLCRVAEVRYSYGVADYNEWGPKHRRYLNAIHIVSILDTKAES